MLNARLATDLVDKLSTHIDFNINIMDDRGIIIASRDPKRVGNFHAAAYRIITGGEDIEILHADDTLPAGVKPGVNLPIVHHGRTVGVVGITGNPDVVLNLAFAIKTSVESIYEYEMYKEKVARRQGIKDQFQNLLLTGEGRTSPDIEDVAEKLGYASRYFRVPMLLRFTGDTGAEEVLRIMKQLPLHSQQDMSFITLTHDVLLFKTVDPAAGGTISAIRMTVESYIRQLRSALSDASNLQTEATPAFRVYVGTLQRDLRLYGISFAHAKWLVAQAAPEDEIVYFSDYVYRYINNSIPSSVFENIFAVPVGCAHESAGSQLTETVDALLVTNMSIKAAAASLGIHRNTMRLRMERIGRQFGIDPLNNGRDREFLMCLSEYLRLISANVSPP
ncbi:MAG TPA: sugar diacid recognition domain-containing protein [Spirochaetia bacterium]|nr:sugar diacid recognition domain-containing protein [Spirochaetia bacterium]